MEDLFHSIDPRFLALLPVASGAVKLGMDWIKRAAPEWQGGQLTIATAALSAVVAVVTAGASGVYSDGVTFQEGCATAVLAWALMTGANWVNEAMAPVRKRRREAEARVSFPLAHPEDEEGNGGVGSSV